MKRLFLILAILGAATATPIVTNDFKVIDPTCVVQWVSINGKPFKYISCTATQNIVTDSTEADTTK